jgi:hypothetical protein
MNFIYIMVLQEILVIFYGSFRTLIHPQLSGIGLAPHSSKNVQGWENLSVECLTPRSQNSETLAVESFSNLRGQQKEYHSEKAMAELYLLSYLLTRLYVH